MRPARRLLLCAGLLPWLACTTLPDYAAPRGWVIEDPASLDQSDVIPYRTLTRSDFRGTEPPPWMAPYADRVGAATCAHILTTKDTQIQVEPYPTSDGSLHYRATPHHLRFHAQMDRSCSWWNPEDMGLPSDYILEHEQIHLAIVELEARRLNERVPELATHLNATAPTAEGAVLAAQEQLQEQIRRRMEDILARSRAFDEDTSMGHRPERQRRWWNQVHRELAATAD